MGSKISLLTVAPHATQDGEKGLAAIWQGKEESLGWTVPTRVLQLLWWYQFEPRAVGVGSWFYPEVKFCVSCIIYFPVTVSHCSH